MKNSKVIASLALGSVITLGGCATNPFVAEPMQSGHHGAEQNMEGSCSDKHMEGSCSDKNMEGSCSDKQGEGSCGTVEKDAEGKCGEGKCGS